MTVTILHDVKSFFYKDNHVVAEKDEIMVNSVVLVVLCERIFSTFVFV